MAIAKLSIDMEVRLANFERELKHVQAISEQTARRIDGAFSAAQSAVSGIAAAIGGAVTVGALKETINYLDRLDESAERLSLSVEDLSALNFSGKLSGLTDDDMTMALTKLSVKMQDAASGGKEAITLFSDLGVKATDSSGKLKAADVVFAEVAERFSMMKDGAGKTAFAVDLFGKSGAALVPLLNRGAEGLEKMRREAEALGAIINGDLAKQAADFNDNLDRLSVVSGAAGRAISAELLPSMNKLSEEFLAGITSAGGFWAALSAGATLNPFASTGENLKSVAGDIAKMEADLKDYGYIDEQRLKRKKDQLAYLKQIQILEAMDLGKGAYSNEGRGKTKQQEKKDPRRTPQGGGKTRGSVAERAVSFTDYDQQLTQSIAAAIDKTDIVKAAELVRQLEKLDQLASAGLDPVIVKAVRDDLSGATKAAADELARLNKLFDETPTAKLEAVRDDMQFLTAALVKGRIGEEQYLEAIGARLDTLADKTKEAVGELDEFTKAAAKNIESTLADFLYDPFSEGMDGMAKKFGQTIQRMVADAAAAQLARSLFGDMGKTGEVGGWAGAAIGWISKSLPSFDVGTDYVPGDMVAKIHKGERIVPAAQNRPGMHGGGSMSLIQNFYGPADPAQVKRSAASGYRAAADAMAAAGRYR